MAFDITSYILGKKSGGGSQNSKTVISGMVSNVFTDNMTADEWSAFRAGLISGDIHAICEIDASGLGLSTVIQPFILYDIGSSTLSYYGEVGSNTSLSDSIYWDKDSRDCDYAWLEQNGTNTDLLPYASMIPITVTIYYHPMP